MHRKRSLPAGWVTATRFFLIAAIAAAFLMLGSAASAVSDEEIEERLRDIFGEAWDSGDWPEDLKEAFRQAERERPPPRELTAEELEEAERRAEERAEEAARRRVEEWEARLKEVKGQLRSIDRPSGSVTTERVEAFHNRLQAIEEKAAALRATSAERASALDQAAREIGAERVRVWPDGRREILAGVLDGQPIYFSSQNLYAAQSLSAHEVWPGGASGFDLTGDGVALGLWEVDGAVRVDHLEFEGRAVQVDDDPVDPLDTAWHATGVAATMAAGGVLQFQVGNQSVPLIHGVAFEAEINGYTLRDFAVDRLEAAAGIVTGVPLLLSNHSYGAAGGWIKRDIVVLEEDENEELQEVLIPDVWVWRGHPALAEEWKFGFYSPSAPDTGAGSADIDAFLAEDAPHHLMIYAAGNDRLTGPGQPTTYYYHGGGDEFDWVRVDNPHPDSRVWINGDEGGYDTILMPGTSKNVLTVGAVQDVFHVVDNELRLGYGPNATVTVAPFSGMGPTDDGRIRPDIVAVGQRNPLLRDFGIVTAHDFATNSWVQTAGTSFAAPAVTGGLGLALQRRAQLFPDLDPETEAWRGSTLRALAIHTADDVGAPGPDYRMGFGLFNAVSVATQIDLDKEHGRGTQIKEFEALVSETVVWEVELDGSPFKKTLTWSDPAGPGHSTISVDPQEPMLVNNLHLRVKRLETSEVFFPWILDRDLANQSAAARSAPATTGIDNRNNVNQVAVPAPAPGRYRIIVEHGGGLAGGLPPTDQWVSVILSGGVPIGPKVTSIERSPVGTEVLLSFTADPGAYFDLLESTNLVDWTVAGTVVAEGVDNALLVEIDQPRMFWRLRRQQ